jgi:hypothetical protein
MIAHFPWLGTGTPIRSGDKWLSSMQLSFIMVVKITKSSTETIYIMVQRQLEKKTVPKHNLDNENNTNKTK